MWYNWNNLEKRTWRNGMQRFIIPLCLITLVIASTLSVSADASNAPSSQGGVNGADKQAVFATYARVERATYAYSAPGGDAVQYLDGNQAWWVSVKGQQVVNGVTWYRTATGNWVRASDVRILPSPRFRGAYWNSVYNDGAQPNQFGFVLDYNTHVHDNPTANANDLAILQKYAWVPLLGMDRNWWRVGEGNWVNPQFVRVVKPAKRPQGVGAGDKWVDVDLTQQTVTAYEGDTMVFATLTSTGKQTTPTITGLYYVYQKFITHTMRGVSETGTYYLEEVPWSMYFTQNYALHGAYWHDGFGAIRSAGCVNLSPVDAKWLFGWSGPTVPAGENYVRATNDNPGTWVNVHY
jgi:hypothetical protein